MSAWFTLAGGKSLPAFDQLVERYRLLMAPKRAKDMTRAIAEIQRQRGERIDRIERLRQESAALFALERELMAIAADNSRKQPAAK